MVLISFTLENKTREIWEAIEEITISPKLKMILIDYYLLIAEHHTMIKTARAIYSIELDDDHPQYKLIFVFATCPYCARVHTHGPTEYLHAQVTAEKIVNGLQGGRRSANCNGGEYLLDFGTCKVA